MDMRMLVFVVAIASAGAFGCGSTSSGGDAGGGTSGGTAGAGAGGTTGTGGAGGGPATSGVDGSKRLDALTTAEKQMICDFAAAHFGGYNKTIDCGGGVTLSSEMDQASCVAGAPTNCAVTVSDYETCIRAISCADLLPASCSPIFNCT